jgi:hypothetical protein
MCPNESAEELAIAVLDAIYQSYNDMGTDDDGVAKQEAESASSTRATMHMQPSVETDCDADVWKPPATEYDDDSTNQKLLLAVSSSLLLSSLRQPRMTLAKALS